MINYLREGKPKDVTYFVQPCWEMYSVFSVSCLLKLHGKFTYIHLLLEEGGLNPTWRSPG